MNRDGLVRRLEEKEGIPFIVVAPQSPRLGWNVEALDALLHEVLGRNRADADRVYLTASSMGGYGTWALAAAHPERFAAIVPICGCGDPAWALRLRDVPIWAFQGADDREVPTEESPKMVTAVVRQGETSRRPFIPGSGHDAWTRTYADPRLYDWLLAHRRRPVSHGSSVSARRLLRAKAPMLQELKAEWTQEAARKDIIKVLEARFGIAARALHDKLKAVDPERLDEFIKLAATCRSLASFHKKLRS